MGSNTDVLSRKGVCDIERTNGYLSRQTIKLCLSRSWVWARHPRTISSEVGSIYLQWNIDVPGRECYIAQTNGYLPQSVEHETLDLKIMDSGSLKPIQEALQLQILGQVKSSIRLYQKTFHINKLMHSENFCNNFKEVLEQDRSLSLQ